MTLPVTITCAPCCWGVDDVSNPHLPHWERVLEEAAEAGFGGLELGPFGYMPLDVARVGAALEARGLRIVAGTIFDDLVTPRNRQNLLRQVPEICGLITTLPRPKTHRGQRFAAPYLTVMDWGHDERDYAAGHSDRAPRLGPEDWGRMISNIRAIGELARDVRRSRGHPPACRRLYQFKDLDRVAENVPGEIAELCLDTGHMDYSGMDPIRTLRRYAGRTDYIHFKDIDAAKYADVMERRIRFFEACAEGVMCPIGRGRIDYLGLRDLLNEIGYAGYITIEQERDPRNAEGVLGDLSSEPALLAAHRFLRGKDDADARRHHHRPVKRGPLRSADRWSAGGHGIVREIHRGLTDEYCMRHGAARIDVRSDHPCGRRAHGEFIIEQLGREGSTRAE